MKDKPRVAIVCDWLTVIGGAERVVYELHRLFPEAPIYTSQYDPGKIDWFKDADVRTTWLQKLPKAFKKLLPVLRAWSFSRLNLNSYDVVISASGAEAKFVRAAAGAKHISYIHAPTHYYWSRYEDYLKHPGWGRFDWLGRLGLKLLIGPMRRWDFKAAQRPDYLLANSSHTQAAIKKYYGRESVVVHPPVDTERFADIPVVERKGFVVAGRQTPYKRIDLAVAACTKAELPLTVVGSGPDHAKLQKLAGPTVTFVTGANDRQVAEHFASAQAFIFPGIDDFGIVAVEALAAGTPVIAYKAGGALDYITPQTGLFFEAQTIDSLVAVLRKFNPADYVPGDIKLAAHSFDIETFHQNMATELQRILK